MSQVIKFYFTSSVLNMFRTLIHPSSGACDFSIISPHCSCVLVSTCVGVSVWLFGVVSVSHFLIVTWNTMTCVNIMYSQVIQNSEYMIKYMSYKSNVYRTVHHCDSSRIRDQLDVTSY